MGLMSPIGSTIDGVDVFLADEQTDVAVEPMRWGTLARVVLEAELSPTMLANSQVSVMFVDELTIADLNARFLDGDGPTDVLSFPIDDDLVERGRQPDQGGRGPGGPPPSPDIPILLGDVVVCPAVALRQAQERAVSLDEELALLVVHGVLHLLKYDHEEDAERVLMEQRQQWHLDRWRVFDGVDTPDTPVTAGAPDSPDTADTPGADTAEPGATGDGGPRSADVGRLGPEHGVG